MIGFVVGIIRTIALLLDIVLGALVVFLLFWIPVRIKGVRLSAWIITGMSRLALFIFGVKRTCNKYELLKQHKGLLFPNHLSFTDVVVLLAITPCRFMANHKVKKMPFIGWLANSIETVYVNRDQKESRKQARLETVEKLKAQLYPPLVLFPEGGIGNGKEITPLRYGAFEIAIEGQIPYLPCTIRYNALSVVQWHKGERLEQAIWRLATYLKPLTVTLTPDRVLIPQSADIPSDLAIETQEFLETAFIESK